MVGILGFGIASPEPFESAQELGEGCLHGPTSASLNSLAETIVPEAAVSNGRAGANNHTSACELHRFRG
jgi:hypothetical protein